MKLVSVRKLVRDFDGCLRFYRDIIGLELKYSAEGGYYAAFNNEGSDVLLELFTSKDAAAVLGDRPAETPSQYRTLVSFSVPSVDATLEELRGKGADVVGDATDQPAWGVRIAYVRDPDGNLIELFTSLESTHE